MPIKRQEYVCHDYCPLPIVDIWVEGGLCTIVSRPAVCRVAQIDSVTNEIRDVIAAKRAATERNSDILEKIFFLLEKDDSATPFYKILNEIHYDYDRWPCTGERTTRTSASYQIIEKDYQGLKIFKEGKIFQKYLKRKSNCLSRMPSKESLTEPTEHRYRGSIYVKMYKSAPTLFHSQL